MIKRFTSRSAVLTALTCMLKRYLTYHVGGSGVVPEKYSIDLLIGTCVHRGLQHLLEHCRIEHPNGDFEEACVDQAVFEAKKVWQEALETHSLYLHADEDIYIQDIIAEQECLFEGLIRAFAIYKLPGILDMYEVLEVEHEEVFEDFSSTTLCLDCNGTGYANNLKDNCEFCGGNGVINKVIFLGKADGLFRIKSGINENKLVVLSIKTSSEYPEVTQRNMMHDMQGVSEWVIIQNRLDKQFIEYQRIIKIENGSELYGEFCKEIGFGLSNYFLLCNAKGITPEIFAVVYEHLLKGKRRQNPYGSGIYKQDSFLIHPAKRDSFMVVTNRAVSIGADEYKWKKHVGRMPKGWSYINIYDDIGIKNWIEVLATGQIQPEEGHPFETILKTSDLIIRTQEEIEEWKVSTRFLEETIVEHLEEIEKVILDQSLYTEEGFKQTLEELIWKYFPKNTQNCHDYYGRDCQFVPVCHENVDLANAIDAGVYVNRESHHDMERLYQIESREETI